MAIGTKGDMENPKGHPPKNTPPIVSAQEWEAARQQLLAKEKALTRSRDALAAERRRMPWLLVDKKYEFDGPKGKVSLLNLFEGRRQLIVYRAFFEPGCSAGPSTPAAAARSAPIRSPTWRICTPATPRSRTPRARHKRTLSA